MLFVYLKGIKGMCLSKNKGDKLLKVSLTKGTVYKQSNSSSINYILQQKELSHDDISHHATVPFSFAVLRLQQPLY